MAINYPLRPFNRLEISSLNPGQNGVYGIYSGPVCIYIGKGDVRQRLLAHLNGDNYYITNSHPTHWTGEVIVGDPSSREKELILELRPICNQRIG